MTQSLVDESHIASARDAFASNAAPSMHCSVKPVQPALDFSFRFHAGYTIEVRLSEFQEAKHLDVLLRVTPEGGDPVYLVSGTDVPAQEKTKGTLEISGEFLVGEGAYRVAVLMTDNSHADLCRAEWQIEAKPEGNERSVTLGIQRETVNEIAALPAWTPDRAPSDRRLTVIMNAAPLSRRASQLQPEDISVLLGSLASLVREQNAAVTRLIVLSLDHQKVLYRSDSFALHELGTVREGTRGIAARRRRLPSP